MATDHTKGAKKPKRKSRSAVPDQDRHISESAEPQADPASKEGQRISFLEQENNAAAQVDKGGHSSQSDFNSFYLQQMTKEFGTDLDKLRTASDFRPNSLPLLIEALKQGTACFSDSERQRIASGLRNG